MESLGYVFRALIGIIGILGLAYLLSSDRRNVNWRVVAGGLVLQIIIAAGVLLFPAVEALFSLIAQMFAIALEISVNAAGFVFGPLADLAKMEGAFGRDNGFVFAFMALPAYCFFPPFLPCFSISAYSSSWSGKWLG